jgi:hypothetical protein
MQHAQGYGNAYKILVNKPKLKRPFGKPGVDGG